MAKKPAASVAGDTAGTAIETVNGHFDAKSLLAALKTLKKGDFGVRLPVDDTVIGAALAEAFNDLADLLENDTRVGQTVNTMVDQLGSFASEVTRVAREVGTEGKLGGQAEVQGVAGTWKDLTDSVNSMAGNLTAQVRNIAEVTTAVANGDLSKKITVDVRGEILELKDTINTMVDQLGSFASRGDPRRPRGRLGRPARRPGPGPGRGRASGRT